MKNLFTLPLLLFALNVCAQSPINIDKNGLVTLDGKAWLKTKDTVSANVHVTEVKNLAEKIIAVLTFVDYEDKVFFRGTFAASVSEYEYEVNYPVGTNLKVILESYYKNKVIVNDHIDLAGLEKYCKDRNVELVEMMIVNVVDPPSNNNYNYGSNNQSTNYNSNNQTTIANQTKQNTSTTITNNNVSFKLKNNSSKTVRYFIGSKPKYGSGSTKNIGGNNLTNEYATAGQQFCIVDGNNNAISCMEINATTQKIEINTSGSGFGK